MSLFVRHSFEIPLPFLIFSQISSKKPEHKFILKLYSDIENNLLTHFKEFHNLYSNLDL